MFRLNFNLKPKDILYVKEKLGHRRLETTLIYTHLIDFEDEDFTVKAVKTVGEAVELLESGFEYVTEMDNIKPFRKRK